MIIKYYWEELRLTIIVDVIKEEADKDYQMAAGITQDVEADDSILELTKGPITLVVFRIVREELVPLLLWKVFKMYF